MNRVLLSILSVVGCHTIAVQSSLATPVALQNATATFSQTSFGGFPVAWAIDGDFSSLSGWAVANGAGTDAQPAIAAFETASDIGFLEGTQLTFTLSHLHTQPTFHTLGRFRLSATTDPRAQFADGLSSGGDVEANWVVLQPTNAAATNGVLLTILGDDSVLASGPNPEISVYTVVANTSLVGITGFRLEAMEDPSLPSNGPGRYGPNGNFVIVEFEVDAAPIPEPRGLTLLLVSSILPLTVILGRRGLFNCGQGTALHRRLLRGRDSWPYRPLH